MLRRIIKTMLLLLFIVIISSCSKLKNVDKESKNNSKNTTISDEIIVGKDYKFKGLTNIYNSIDIFNETKAILRLSNTDDKVNVKEVNGDFAKIDFHGKEGWVIKWYLTNTQGNEITQISKEPFEKVVVKDSFFYIFPDENKSHGYKIKAGEVVHIMAEYKDWYCIELIEYEGKTYIDKWIKKSNTIDLKYKTSKEDNPFQSKREYLKEKLLQTFLRADKIEFGTLSTGETYAYIDGEKIKKFVELIRNGDIGPDPYQGSDGMHTFAELVVSSSGNKQILIIGDGYIQSFLTERWMENQNYLLFKDPSTNEKIKELFERYPDEDTRNANNWKPTVFEALNNIEGVSMSIKKETITPSKLTLVFKNNSKRQCLYGEAFTLEKKLKGKWYQVPISLVGDYGFNTIGYNLSSGETNELLVDWEWLYGKLVPGEYRIVKDILDFRGTAYYDSYYLSAEFSIN